MLTFVFFIKIGNHNVSKCIRVNVERKYYVYVCVMFILYTIHIFCWWFYSLTKIYYRFLLNITVSVFFLFYFFSFFKFVPSFYHQCVSLVFLLSLFYLFVQFLSQYYIYNQVTNKKKKLFGFWISDQPTLNQFSSKSRSKHLDTK